MSLERYTEQRGYVLHRSRYRETSFLLQVYTETGQTYRLIAKGALRKAKQWGGLLQPFIPLVMNFSGRADKLHRLDVVEPRGNPLVLKGDSLLAGFYINELLVRLLQKTTLTPELFSFYEETLLNLQENPESCWCPLRYFEMRLLDSMGFGIDAEKDSFGKAIASETQYRFSSEDGFVPWPSNDRSVTLYPGALIQSLEAGELTQTEAKKLKSCLQVALKAHLGRQPLQSSQLIHDVWSVNK